MKMKKTAALLVALLLAALFTGKTVERVAMTTYKWSPPKQQLAGGQGHHSTCKCVYITNRPHSKSPPTQKRESRSFFSL